MLSGVIAVVAALLLQGPGPDGSGATVDVELRVPDAGWAISVAPPDFEFGEPFHSSDGTKILVAGDGLEPGLEMTVLLERRDVEDVGGCLAHYEKQIRDGPTDHERWRRGELNGMPTFSYIVRRYQTTRIDQRNLHGFLYRAGYCVHAHVSLMKFRSELHEVLMQQAMASVTLIEVVEPAGAR